MLFIEKQHPQMIEKYKDMMQIIGSMSGLYSDADEPFYPYRISENLFCLAFKADNLSRSDISADARKIGIGIGIKTFLEKNGSTFQKIAEFSEVKFDGNLKTIELIKQVADLRNKRLKATRRIANVHLLIYHCIVRNAGYMRIFEITMEMIATDSIKLDPSKVDSNNVWFTDGIHDYKYNVSKSTLYMRFITPEDTITVDISIIDNPFELLEKLLGTESATTSSKVANNPEYVVLPLYSDRVQAVQERSGLNQWNAKGRPRHPDEVYIPIPAVIHKKFPDFFPPRDENFQLQLPNGDVMNAKVCQENSKALMSNPNKHLGKWLLRDVLELEERQLLTMEMLNEIGFDSVIIHKQDNRNFEINFKESGTYNDFKTDYLVD